MVVHVRMACGPDRTINRSLSLSLSLLSTSILRMKGWWWCIIFDYATGDWYIPRNVCHSSRRTYRAYEGDSENALTEESTDQGELHLLCSRSQPGFMDNCICATSTFWYGFKGWRTSAWLNQTFWRTCIAVLMRSSLDVLIGRLPDYQIRSNEYINFMPDLIAFPSTT